MSDNPSSPFKGLNAFADSELDALLFFGREREREIVVANLIASRLTVLYGPSGVGKSSLLSAAVARSLRELPEEPLVVVFSRWSDDPSEALSQAIAEATGAAVDGSPLQALEQAQDGRDVYLVLDQTEEYFLYHADDSGPGSFSEALPGVLAAPLRINVLVSLREDSLAKLDRFTGRIPGLFANTLRLDRLDRQAAKAAIIGPIERYAELTGTDVSIEPELIERVLDEVGAGQIEPALGGLGGVVGGADGARIEAPYLQLVLQRLWEEEQSSGSGMLRLATLERLGGAQHIVEEHLEGAMSALSAGQKDVAARLFNHLVTPSGTKIAHEVSDLADFGQVPIGELQPVLATLSERRILRSLEEGGGVRYEIFHDVLAQPVLAWRARHRTEREIQRQLAESHRRRRRLQLLFGLVLVALALMAGVTAYALDQRREARQQAEEAKARGLDATAAALLQSDPELALVLASEAARLSPTRSAENVLRQALTLSHLRGVYPTDGEIVDLEVARDGGVVAFASRDGTARLVDLAEGREVWRKQVGPGGGVSFDRRRSDVLIHGSSLAPTLVDTETGAVRATFGDAPVRDAALSGDGSLVVTLDGELAIWDAESTELLRRVDVGRDAVEVVPSPEGRRAAIRLRSRIVPMITLASGVVAYELEHGGRVSDIAFSLDGSIVATAGGENSARLWDARTGQQLERLRGHFDEVLAVSFNGARTRVATAGADGQARVWRVDDGSFLSDLTGHTNFVNDVDFSEPGGSLVTASSDRTARTWRAGGRPVDVLAGHGDAVTATRFAEDGATVVTSGRDGSVRVWDSGTLPDLAETAAQGPSVPARTARSPDGTITATTDGKTVKLSGPTGTQVLEGHRRAITSLAFSRDGSLLVTASRDRRAAIWDVENGTLVKFLDGHFGPVADARFSPDGRWVVTAGPASAGLWAVSGGDDVRFFLYGPTSPLVAAAFTANSRRILTREKSGTVRSYACVICRTLPELLRVASRRLTATGRELTPAERERYLR